MTTQTFLIGATCAAVFCLAGAAMGQLHQLSQQKIGNAKQQISTKTVIIVTPEMKAKLEEAGRLENAALVAMRAGNYQEAEADARQSVSVDYGSGVGQKLLAEALYAQGKDQEALEAYKQMVDVGSDEPADLLPYSLLSLKAGHWAQAVAAFNKSLPLINEPIQGSQAALQDEFGHFSPSVPKPRVLETALHIALGMNYDATYTWGGRSQDSKSLTEYAQAYQMSPSLPLAVMFEGRRLQKLHRFAEAKSAFAKAATLGNMDVKAAAEKAIKGL